MKRWLFVLNLAVPLCLTVTAERIQACTGDICDTCIDFWVHTNWPWVMCTQPSPDYVNWFSATAYDDHGEPCALHCIEFTQSVEGWCWKDADSTGNVQDLLWTEPTGYSPATSHARCWFSEPGIYVIDVNSWDDDGQEASSYVEIIVVDLVVTWGPFEACLANMERDDSWLPREILQYLTDILKPAAEVYQNAAQAFNAAYLEDPELSHDEQLACENAAANLEQAYQGYSDLLNGITYKYGDALVELDPGSLYVTVEEVPDTDTPTEIEVTCEVAAWYSTRDSFSPADRLWNMIYPGALTLGPQQTIRIDKNGHAGKIRITVEAGVYTKWKTVVQEVEIPLAEEFTEEFQKVVLDDNIATEKKYIEDCELTWKQGSNLVDIGNGFIQWIPVVGDIIVSGVNVLRGMAKIDHDDAISTMHYYNILTYERQRSEIEKLYEKLPAGGLEDDDLAADIAQFKRDYP